MKILFLRGKNFLCGLHMRRALGAHTMSRVNIAI